MPSKILYSKHNKKFAEKIKDRHKDMVVAIGGGSIIDEAKILAMPNRCVAYPATAAGACMTSHAVKWGRRHEAVPCKIPILGDWLEMDIKLPYMARLMTTYDCVCHAVESLWSMKATEESKQNARLALQLVNDYINDYDLILAGNLAGSAIEVGGTNIFHALSYPLTTGYNIHHGLALAMVFWPVYKYFGQPFEVPKLKKIPFSVNVDLKWVVDEAFTYPKINGGLQCPSKQALLQVLKGS